MYYVYLIDVYQIKLRELLKGHKYQGRLDEELNEYSNETGILASRDGLLPHTATHHNKRQLFMQVINFEIDH